MFRSIDVSEYATPNEKFSPGAASKRTIVSG
jgi:hypothetical protein